MFYGCVDGGIKANYVIMVVSQAGPLSWILQKDPTMNEWDPSVISNYGDLPD